jgi:hypothetical protein
MAEIQMPSSKTVVLGTSGAYHLGQLATGSRRSPPYQDSETLQILEGNGPYVLDGRDIGRLQFQPE